MLQSNNSTMLFTIDGCNNLVVANNSFDRITLMKNSNSKLVFSFYPLMSAILHVEINLGKTASKKQFFDKTYTVAKK